MASERMGFCSIRDLDLPCTCPYRTMFTILYTKKTMQVAMDYWWNAFYGGTYADENDYWRNLDLSLGHDARFDNPDPEFYWNEVRRHILEIVTKAHWQLPITDLILLGESAEEPEFSALVHDITTHMQKENFTVHAGSPLYAAARGAADYHAMTVEPPTPAPNNTMCDSYDIGTFIR